MHIKRQHVKVPNHHVITSRIAENFIALPVIALVVGIISYWAMITDRLAPLDLTHGTITPDKVAPGEDIMVRWHVNRMRANVCSAVITRSIIDATNVVWHKPPQQMYERTYPTNETIATAIQVPFPAAWGPARYRVEACFRCSGLSLTQWFPVCYREGDLMFEIIPPPKVARPPVAPL